jgi:hypothetical protein
MILHWRNAIEQYMILKTIKKNIRPNLSYDILVSFAFNCFFFKASFDFKLNFRIFDVMRRVF